MKIRVFATTTFEGFHCWPTAPDEVAFLRVRHRHVFHVRVEWVVNHDDRDIEFILAKRRVDVLLQQHRLDADRATWSCESWAAWLLETLGAVRVEVSEDGENGAVVENS